MMAGKGEEDFCSAAEPKWLKMLEHEESHFSSLIIKNNICVVITSVNASLLRRA